MSLENQSTPEINQEPKILSLREIKDKLYERNKSRQFVNFLSLTDEEAEEAAGAI